MAAKRSITPEYLEVRVMGDGFDTSGIVVSVNGRERSDGLNRPLLVQPGVHKVEVTGFAAKKVEIQGGETDGEFPKVVEFAYPADAAP